MAVHMGKTKLVFNKPIYVGMSILDVSKVKMYDFHYNYIKKKYGEDALLLMTDTDSLCYEIKTEDFFKDISGDVEAMFDTSAYPKNISQWYQNRGQQKSNWDDEGRVFGWDHERVRSSKSQVVRNEDGQRCRKQEV